MLLEEKDTVVDRDRDISAVRFTRVVGIGRSWSWFYFKKSQVAFFDRAPSELSRGRRGADPERL